MRWVMVLLAFLGGVSPIPQQPPASSGISAPARTEMMCPRASRPASERGAGAQTKGGGVGVPPDYHCQCGCDNVTCGEFCDEARKSVPHSH